MLLPSSGWRWWQHGPPNWIFIAMKTWSFTVVVIFTVRAALSSAALCSSASFSKLSSLLRFKSLCFSISRSVTRKLFQNKASGMRPKNLFHATDRMGPDVYISKHQSGRQEKQSVCKITYVHTTFIPQMCKPWVFLFFSSSSRKILEHYLKTSYNFLPHTLSQ